jgi:hypothetical protein
MNRTTSFLCLIFCLMIVSVQSIAQPPDTLWTRTYGTEIKEQAYFVEQTSDGGFIFTGMSYRPPLARSYNVLLTKTDGQGNVEWSRILGGYDFDIGLTVHQAEDGGYAIFGTTSSFAAQDEDFMLIKTDAEGYVEFFQNYGRVSIDRLADGEITADCGYIMVGSSVLGANYDLMLIKADSNGNPVWTRFYGQQAGDYRNSVQQTIDGGFIIAGNTRERGSGREEDIWLIKTDEYGIMEWERTFGACGRDYGFDVQQTHDGGYIITGRTYLPEAESTAVRLIKTDAEGIEEWNRRYDHIDHEQGMSVKQTADLGYVITGWSDPLNTTNDEAFVLKTNQRGFILWGEYLGGDESDYANCVQVLPNGGILVAGSTRSFGNGSDDAWLIRYAPEDPFFIEFAPANPSVVIPVEGGSFEYGAHVQNRLASPQTFDAWVEVEWPDGSMHGPYDLHENLMLASEGSFSVTLVHEIGADSPTGEYTIRGCLGTYLEVVDLFAEFTVEKLGDGS